MNIDKFTIISFDQLMGFDRATGSLDLILDELKDFTLSQSEEKVDITGRGGRVIGSLKKNKKVTGKGTNGMLVGGALAAMTGSELESGSFHIRCTDTLTVTGNTAKTTAAALGTPGMEIGTVYVRESKNSALSDCRALTQDTTASAGKFSCATDTGANTSTLTFFDGDIPDGTEIIVFYDAKVTGKKISNDADTYSKTLSVYVDVTCTDGCDNIFHGQFIIDRADFSGTFDIAGGSDPSALAFEFTSLPDLCTNRGLLWDFIVFS